MTFKPGIHGRDHAPTGSDPIPFLTGMDAFGEHTQHAALIFLSGAPVIDKNGDWEYVFDSGGDSGVFAKLFDETKASAGANFSTGTLPTDSAHLLMVAHVRTAQAVVQSTVSLRLNGDTGSNYDVTGITGTGGAVTHTGGSAISSINSFAPGANAASGVFGMVIAYIPDYRGTTAEKTVSFMAGFTDETDANSQLQWRIAHWRNTAAITSLLLFNSGGSNLEAGSRMTLYGLG